MGKVIVIERASVIEALRCDPRSNKLGSIAPEVELAIRTSCDYETASSMVCGELVSLVIVPIDGEVAQLKKQLDEKMGAIERLSADVERMEKQVYETNHLLSAARKSFNALNEVLGQKE